uniref:Uncharacterized protein n=1 Tax=viral metagenome TaxID=1070528 RepID=A0A6M3KCP2_9ZZZZ
MSYEPRLTEHIMEWLDTRGLRYTLRPSPTHPSVVVVPGFGKLRAIKVAKKNEAQDLLENKYLEGLGYAVIIIRSIEDLEKSELETLKERYYGDNRISTAD